MKVLARSIFAIVLRCTWAYAAGRSDDNRSGDMNQDRGLEGDDCINRPHPKTNQMYLWRLHSFFHHCTICPSCDTSTCQRFHDVKGSSDQLRQVWHDSGYCRIEEVYQAMVVDEYDETYCTYDSEKQCLIEDVDEGVSWQDCCTSTDCNPSRARELNREENLHHRRVMEMEDGATVHIKSNDSEEYNWVKLHLEDMKDRLESGDIARKWDPLFSAYFEHANQIQTECVHSPDDSNFSCVRTSSTQCGQDLIKALLSYHEEIRDSILDQGTHSVRTIHDVPESCQN